MSRKIAFTSLGCDKNRVDSEVMLGILQKNGYTAVADEAEADIIVVNTCCFIKDALEESIETILEMAQYKNPDVGNCKGLIVAGCLGQRYEKEFFDELPEVDAIIGTTAYESIAEVADEILGGKLVGEGENHHADDYDSCAAAESAVCVHACSGKASGDSGGILYDFLRRGLYH